MLIDRSHRAWALFSLISLTAATIGWTVSLKYSPAGASGGSFPGLLFGILGTAMMLFAGLLAGRRPLRHLPLGSARFWMKGHLWLGTLCIPFILFHSGFAWGGVLEQLLWYCLAFVALSGFFGLAVQQFLPGLLWKSVPLETFEPQSPWLCDRLTLVNDTKLSALCERQLDAPSPHLQEPAKRTVAAYQKLMDGPGARNEKNARKLLLLQEVSPPAVRDFFWAMAKYCRTELKAIGFDGDFPELLRRLYSALRPPTVPSDPEPPAAQPVQSTATPPAAPPESAAPAVTKVSPLDAMRQKAALKTAAAPGAVGGAAPLATSADASSEPSPAVSSVAPAAAPVKLSPLEQMRQKAALKAAAASGAVGGAAPLETPVEASSEPSSAVSSVAPASAPVKLSPLEQMRQKAALKAAAASGAGGGAAPLETPADASSEPSSAVSSVAPTAAPVKLSPLEQMRQKAALKAAAASGAVGGPAPLETPAEASSGPSSAVSSVAPASAPVKLSPLDQMRQKAALKAAAASGAGGGPAPLETSAEASSEPSSAVSSVAPAAAPVKLSPLEQMRQKAALKAAAASGAGGGAAPLETSVEASSGPSSAVSSVAPASAPVKLSPLEQMRQKAAAASGAGGGGAASETPAAASPKPAPAAAAAAASTPSASAVKPPVAVKSPAGKSPTPPVKPPGDGSAGGRQPPTESAPPISLSPDEKGVLWDFYVNQVRPYLMEHGSGGVVRRSRFATEMGAQRVFREQKALLPKSLHAVLDDLYGSVEVRRQLEQQRRLLRWMHWWLMLHVPVSILLLVFLAAHVLMALRVVPLQF